MIVVTSMNKLPHSCMRCPFQKNQKTPFCRAVKRGLSSDIRPPYFGFYITDAAFDEKWQTPWNSRAKWCPLKEVKEEGDGTMRFDLEAW